MKPTPFFKLLIQGLVFSFFILSALFYLPSCTHDPLGIEALDSICFDQEVLPIIQTSCGKSGCHSGGSSEGFDASNYLTIMHSVRPGDPRGSMLYKAITNINGENMMPPDQPLTKEQRMIIEVWIAQGASETICDNGSGGGNGTDSICFAQHILPLFISNCAMASCHDGLSQTEDDLYALNNYSTIRSHVVPGSPSNSDVYRAVNGLGEDFMPPPPKSPLTATQKELLRKWISDGALNSDCPDATCDTSGTISFTSQIKPVIDNYCVSCHNSSVISGGVNLNGYAQVSLYASTIRNGTPVLVGVINQITGFKAMPPSIKLDACTIRTIELWIDQGTSAK